MADAFRYPTDVLDDPAGLLALLGSFWSDVYQQGEFVADMLASRALLERQSLTTLHDVAACVARRSTPIGQQRLWHRCIIRESERNHTVVNAVEYGTAATYYGGNLNYGDQDPDNFSIFPVDADLLELPAICNRLTEATVALTHGLDFTLDAQNHVITLQTNPFDDPITWAVRTVYEGETAVDQEAVLWFFRPRCNAQYLQDHVASPLQLQTEETATARRFLNAVWDAVVEGSCLEHLLEAVSALCDVSLVRGETETIEVIDVYDPAGVLIVTDQDVYRFQRGSTPIVELGDTVHRGDPLVDSLQLIRFQQGKTPPASTLPAVAISREMLGSDYRDGLNFENREYATTVDTSGTKTEITFPVGGWSDDVARFWQSMQSRGILQGNTLAELLDSRERQNGQPSAAFLPATVNPLTFLIQNVLRNHAGALRIKPGLFGPEALAWGCWRILRQLLPPQALWLLITELVGPVATVTMQEVGSITQPGFTASGYLAGALSGVAATISADALITASIGTMTSSEAGCL